MLSYVLPISHFIHSGHTPSVIHVRVRKGVSTRASLLLLAPFRLNVSFIYVRATDSARLRSRTFSNFFSPPVMIHLDGAKCHVVSDVIKPIIYTVLRSRATAAAEAELDYNTRMCYDPGAIKGFRKLILFSSN